MLDAARCLIRGSINIDEFFHVNNTVRPGETISSSHLEKRAGGKGANQAVAVARAGGQVDLVGAIGRDGIWVKSQLENAGVDVSGVLVAEESTGRAVIQLTSKGENSIILFKGANFSSIPQRSMHARTTHILLQNEIPFSDTIAQIAAANDPSLAKPLSTIFNPSPMPSQTQLLQFPWDKLTWLIVNEGEASDLVDILVPSPASRVVPNEDYASLSAYPLILRLAERIPTTNIVCTLGAAGVLALLSSFEGNPVYLPAAHLEGTVRDTTGAGDCFTGYLIAGLIKMEQDEIPLTKDKLTDVLRRCIQAAGMCVEKRGAMESIPAGSDVDIRLLA
ncbi:Ribokinase-like protein [Armillaria luteobubalina]|uniref:Ribokinase n=1 Tax=Armillaria luteobubalina TaxID=153913 RepID=A0AA39Q8E4_9AGAR|nr:Ribokinase-like protein [Armillaria luteobubalina]